MLDRLGLHLTPPAARLAARHWPGPLTLVIPGGDRRVPERLLKVTEEPDFARADAIARLAD